MAGAFAPEEIEAYIVQTLRSTHSYNADGWSFTYTGGAIGSSYDLSYRLDLESGGSHRWYTYNY